MNHLLFAGDLDAAVDLCRALRESFEMAWATLWALVIGFSISGAIREFLPERTLARVMGDHRPRSVLLASLFGSASSSCSYAAASTTRTLIAKGSDLICAIAFLIVSTNLVIELGVVLVVLIGWQFLVGEFVGGALMIVLVALFGGVVFRGVRVRTAIDAIRTSAQLDRAHDGEVVDDVALRVRIRRGARFAKSDAVMLRRELLIGFLVAGLLTEFVPAGAWSHLFWSGHGHWTEVENAVVAPGVALLSFVCSIGNVPLAATFWKGGLSFAGTASFLFADLISLPVLLTYRRLFGRTLTIRVLLLFWPVMSLAGLLVGFAFDATGLLPRAKPSAIAGGAFGLNITSALDVVALVGIVAIALLANSTSAERGRYRTDPVCGMEVDTTLAAARIEVDNKSYYFCSEGCAQAFRADPTHVGVDRTNDAIHVSVASDHNGSQIDSDSTGIESDAPGRSAP